jgi:dTDP-4-amino-4,6-dideoxygalactose transaminase
MNPRSIARLAIDGGAPVREHLLPYGRQTIEDDDVAAVAAMLREPLLTTGPHVAAFEAALAARCGVGHVVAVNNGTTALHAMYVAAGLREGDEVVVPPVTFAATAVAALWCGARPVFADLDSETLNLSAARAADAVTPRTRFVTTVDFAGLASDAGALRDATQRPVYCDGAHSLGATVQGRPVQSTFAAATTSFHPVKHITTGEGGAVLTDDAELAARVRRFRHHNLVLTPEVGPWAYDIAEPGMNYRLPDINAALGVSQLAKLDRFLARRRALAQRYRSLLAPFAEVLEGPPGEGETHAWHLFIVRVRGAFAERRRWVFDALRAEGIGVQMHYAPLHLHTLFRERFGHTEGDFPVAEDYGRRAVSLPIFPGMTDADQDDVVEALARVLGVKP